MLRIAFLLIGVLLSLPVTSAWALAPVGGSYRSPPKGIHPFVFSDAKDLTAIATAVRPDVVAARKRLDALTKRYVANREKYLQTYSGCDIDDYLRLLTMDLQGSAGAAEVASTLATYATLTRNGFGDAALGERALALAKDILLNWARDGFRDGARFRGDFRQYCEKGKSGERAWGDMPLQIARGMPRWVNAQDLLMGLQAFSPEEVTTLNGFLDNIFELIRSAANHRAQVEGLACVRYSNHVSAHLVGMLAIARLRDRRDLFEALASGGGGKISIPWNLQVQETIYGRGDTVRKCYEPRSDLKGYAQTQDVAPGEILDRFRSGETQTFGYPLGSLSGLMSAGIILQRAGYRPFAFQGDHGQSIRLALDYYSFYLEKYMADHHVDVPDSGSDYPDFRQYAGKQISSNSGSTPSGADGFIVPYLMCAVAYPGEARCGAVVDRARAVVGAAAVFVSVDPLYLPLLLAVPPAAGR